MCPLAGSARVLIVDDDARDLDALAALLRAADCSIAVAANVPDALTMAPALQPDLVMLPLAGSVDGYEAIRTLHSHAATRRTSVALVAAVDAVVDHVWARLHGARLVLTKPYTSEQVKELLLTCVPTR